MDQIVVQALLVGAASLLLLLLVGRLTRRGLITFRYTLAWSAVAIVGLLSVPLLPVVEPVAELVALTPGALLTVAVAVVLGVVALQLSVATSRLQGQTVELAQVHALTTPLVPDGPSGLDARDRPLVVIPAWNEAATVGEVVGRVRAEGYPVVCIDDGSSDDTARAALRGGAMVLRLPSNLGVGSALRTGFRYAVEAGFQRVVQCDADGQHPENSIGELLRVQEREGADMVIGSRFLDPASCQMKVGFARRFAMRLLAGSASRAAGSRLTDATSGFRVIAQPLVGQFADHLPDHYLGDTYEALIAAGRAGYRIREVPVAIGERLDGSSTASVGAALKFLARASAVVALRAHISLLPADRCSSQR